MAAGTGDVAGQQFTGKLADDPMWRRRLNKMHPMANYIGLGDRIQYFTKEGHYTGPASDAISFIADTGGITAGDICAVTGYDSTTGFLKLDQADANAIATATDLWWSPNAVTAADAGFARKTGVFTSSLNTSGATIGDPVYLSATAGGISLSKPSTAASTDVIVVVGTVASVATSGVISIDLASATRIAIHDHTDNDEGGAISVGAALTGTTNRTFETYTGTAEPSIAIGGSSGGSGDFTQTIEAAATLTVGNATILLPNTAGAGDTIVCKTIAETLANKTLTTPTIASFTNATHDHADAAGGGAITIPAIAGTTATTFTFDSDATQGKIAMTVVGGGSNNTLTLSNSVITADRTITFPDATDTLVGLATADSLTNKQLDGFTENGLAGAVSSVHRLVIRRNAMADGSATAVITVTCPNVAHAAALKITALAMVDDQESARCAEGMAIFSREAGSALVGAVATLELAQIATGGTETLTLAYSLSAASGGVGASNTMDLQFTLNTSAAADGEIVVLAELINGEATGITMAAA